MEVTVTPASLAEKPILANLLQLYHYDFTEFIPELKLGEDGLYPYRYLDAYWDPEPGEQRYPLLVRCDGELAGFALVRFVNETYVMAEFFVMRAHRRSGVGARAAMAVFRRFPGKWIVHQVPANLPAQAFWRRVVGEATGGAFEDVTDGDGVTQRFDLTPG
jgi:predicted acetyltransferase